MAELAQSGLLDSLANLVVSRPDTVLTALGLAASVAAWMIDRYWLRRKLIAYRVHLDRHIDLTHGPDDADFKLLHDGNVVKHASMTLVRIRNAGSLDIRKQDVTSTLRLKFPGRVVIGVDVPEANPGTLQTVIRDEYKIKADEIILPSFTLNRKDRFKLLVLLEGESKDPIVGECLIDGGKITSESNRVGPSRRSLAYGGAFLVFAGILFGLVISSPGNTPFDVHCVSGNLDVEGSTAFSPLVMEAAKPYMDSCPGADIVVKATGSLVGVRELAGAGSTSSEARSNRIAVSDGPAAPEYQSLVSHPIAVGVFAVAVNRASGVNELSQKQIQDIYGGLVTNWDQVGGRDVPINIISRGSESGTRRAFEQTVLGAGEPAVSSNDCIKKDRAPGSTVVRCERENTDALLQEVNRIPGAIGYADKSAVAKYSEVLQLRLNGREADIETVRQRAYPFFAVEYFYTYGEPQSDTLLSAFLDYMNSATTKNILRRDGYTPCLDGPSNVTGMLCQ